MEANNAPRTESGENAFFLGKTLASFSHLDIIRLTVTLSSMVSKFHNRIYDPKGQENLIHNRVKGRETFYRRHTVIVTSCSTVKYVLKGFPLKAKNVQNITESAEYAIFLDQTIADFSHLEFISDPLMVSKFQNGTHDSKGQVNEIYTIVNDREMFYRHHTDLSPAVMKSNMFLKTLLFESKECM